jgi:predicted amidophosphoribosyltransferase
VPCYRCNRVQTDPVKGPSLWKRGVIGTEQVLLCPVCQDEDPNWADAFARCRNCGSPRLVIMMGSVVCKECNSDWPVPQV